MKELYPELYQNVYCGFSCPKGWESLIRDLSAKIASLNAVRVAQVKEKFGFLRYYFDPLSDAGIPLDKRTTLWKNYNKAKELIKEAEEASQTTCQECGEYGEPRKSSWVSTLCNDHANGMPSHWGPRAKCKLCQTVIQSKFQHDFKYCECGAIFVDGGGSYTRYGGEMVNIEWL